MGLRYDYTDAKNETTAKAKAREDLTQLFLEFLSERFDTVGLVDKNTIGFVFGEVKDNDGFPCDMVAVINPIIKNYQDHIGEKRTTLAYDLQQEIMDYSLSKEKITENN